MPRLSAQSECCPRMRIMLAVWVRLNIFAARTSRWKTSVSRNVSWPSWMRLLAHCQQMGIYIRTVTRKHLTLLQQKMLVCRGTLMRRLTWMTMCMLLIKWTRSDRMEQPASSSNLFKISRRKAYLTQWPAKRSWWRSSVTKNPSWTIHSTIICCRSMVALGPSLAAEVQRRKYSAAWNVSRTKLIMAGPIIRCIRALRMTQRRLLFSRWS